MRFVLSIFLLMFFLGLPTTAFAQDGQNGLQVCNEKSGLAWDMNKEADVVRYLVHHSTGPQVTVEAANFEVVHDPAQAVLDPDTNKLIIKTELPVLPEGPRYFRVRAQDAKSNTSDLSNEVGCDIDFSPGTPILFLQFTAPAPAQVTPQAP